MDEDYTVIYAPIVIIILWTKGFAGYVNTSY